MPVPMRYQRNTAAADKLRQIVAVITLDGHPQIDEGVDIGGPRAKRSGTVLVVQPATSGETTQRDDDATSEANHAVAVGGAAKRAVDLAAASAALLILLPIMLVVAVVVLIMEGRPILIAHCRVGYRGRTFKCFKFRTMVRNSDEVLRAHVAANPEAARLWAEMQKLPDDPRVTRLGHVLRKTSIDELPQVFNILRGEMSCVGPRPVVPTEIARYGKHARHYLRVMPGLTGLWQVTGRSAICYRKRVALDTLYARRWSLWLDLYIMAKTIPALLRVDETA